MVSVEEFTGGIILQKIKDAIWHECDCAVAILSADDILHNGEKNARPNVIFELGYCMGFWDHYYWDEGKLEPVILLKEKTVQVNSDLNGFEFIEYTEDNIAMVKRKLKMGLEKIYFHLVKGEKKKHVRPVTVPSVAELKNDYEMISVYLADKGWNGISFKTLQENVHPKFTEEHVMRIMEKFPGKMRRYKLKNERMGIKILK